MLARRKIRIAQRQLLAALREEGCELVLCQQRLIVIQVPGWDSALAPALRHHDFSKSLWDRFEVTPVADGANDQHEFRLVYFTHFNLLIHALVCGLTFFAAAGARPPGMVGLLLFFLVGSLLLPGLAVYQAHVFFRRMVEYGLHPLGP